MPRDETVGKWLASGGYEPLVGEYMSRLFPDYWLLEFDLARSGRFDVLRALGRDGMIVLGLISTKSGVLEERSQVLARIAAAARVAPLENLGISPQCGFASHERGNPLTQEEQEGEFAAPGGHRRDGLGQVGAVGPRGGFACADLMR